MRTHNEVGNNFAVRMLSGFIMLSVAAAIVLGIWFFLTHHINYRTIDYIKANRKSPFEFTDMAKDIDVDSIDDFGFIVKGVKKLNIHYGKQIIEVIPVAFDNEEYNAKLAEIGINIKYHIKDDGSYEYRVEYEGTPIEEWSRIN